MPARKGKIQDVDLGTCNCCDYFSIINGVVVLIEETQLLRQIEDLKNEYNSLRGTDQNDQMKFVYNRTYAITIGI